MIASTLPIVSLISGGVARGVEGAATYSFEFAKTRVQLRTEKDDKHRLYRFHNQQILRNTAIRRPDLQKQVRTKRVKSEHPGKEKVVNKKNGRVLGMIPSRTFGWYVEMAKRSGKGVL